MNNIMLKLFGFLKSSTKFLKALIMFLITLFILYWMQNLINTNWTWLNFIKPSFENLLNIGESFTTSSITLYKAIFEFKYLIVLTIFVVAYYATHFLLLGIHSLEDIYDSGRRLYKNSEEKLLNKKLANEQAKEQKKVRNYQIYVQTFVKQGIAHREFNIDLEEQNKILLKHLLEKTGFCPSKYNEGYLFDFSSFDKIDDMLDIFSKLNQSKAPLDFLICLQIKDSSNGSNEEDLNTLISLKILNKITTLANTAYRYSFNEEQKYRTSQVGLFQKGKDNFEVHEFISK